MEGNKITLVISRPSCDNCATQLTKLADVIGKNNLSVITFTGAEALTITAFAAGYNTNEQESKAKLEESKAKLEESETKVKALEAQLAKLQAQQGGSKRKRESSEQPAVAKKQRKK